MMKHLSPEQRLQIVEIYFENYGSVRETHRALRPFYGRHNRPSEQLIRLTMERLRYLIACIIQDVVQCVPKKLLLP